MGDRKKTTSFTHCLFLLHFDELAVCPVKVVIVRVTSRRVSSFSNHARNTIQKDIFQSVFFLVQTRLLLARQKGRKFLLAFFFYMYRRKFFNTQIKLILAAGGSMCYNNFKLK